MAVLLSDRSEAGARRGDSTGVLLVGGDADPNIGVMQRRLEDRGILHQPVLFGADTFPTVTWDLTTDELRIDGQVCSPTAMFIRHDVFTSMAEGRPEPGFRSHAWFTTLSGWALAHEQVKILNRDSAREITNKLHVLHVARGCGLRIPRTVVSNSFAVLDERTAAEALIVKPVNGGAFTERLNDVLGAVPQRNGALPAPSIVQEELVPPEVRVYGIGGSFYAFQLVADVLDYRSSSDCEIVPVKTDSFPAGLLSGLADLMDELAMDFGAADFKADPLTGELCFLEINNGPMFAGFDLVSDHVVTDALIDHLIE